VLTGGATGLGLDGSSLGGGGTTASHCAGGNGGNSADFALTPLSMN